MYIEIKGSDIFYSEFGTDNPKHILFIHGLGSSSLTWGDFPEALSTGFHTIAVDLIGFSKSDKPKADYTIPYFSKFIKDFLRQIGTKDDDKIIIIGHSLGGYIALEYAIENKEQIDKLVLIDSSGMLNEPTELLEKYKESVLEQKYFERHNLLTRVFEDMLADSSRYVPSKAIGFMKIIEQPGAEDAFESAYENSTKGSIDLQRLKQIVDIPCLIIWGKNDKLIFPSDVKKFADVLKNTKIEPIDDAGHSPHVEKPTITYEKIKTFLL
ncbi:MAG: alpha/beta hydrolase [Candidatus Nitrosocosmicus sp.]